MKKPVERKHVPLLRRPSLSNNSEGPWRSELELMTRDELVDAAISAAWHIKGLEADVDRLWKKHCKQEEARRKAPAARLANDAREAAKTKIKRTWLEQRQKCEPGRGHQSKFMRDMWQKYPVIQDLRTIERWIGGWKKEEAQEYVEAVPTSWLELEAQAEARPDIYKVLNYYPKGFFKLPVDSASI